MATTIRPPVFVSDISPQSPDQRFIERFRETVRSYVMGSNWIMLDFSQFRDRGNLLVRISLRAPNATEDLDLAFTYDLNELFLSNTRLEIGHAQIQNAIHTIRDEMAQWNLRQHERLEQQQRQRREAAQRNRGEEVQEAEHHVGFRLTDYQRDMMDRAVHVSPPPIQMFTQPVSASSQYTYQVGNGTANTSFLQQPFIQTVDDENKITLTRTEVLSLIAEAFKKLDIRISLDESDGEVNVDVEVTYEGEVVASDSDHIQL